MSVRYCAKPDPEKLLKAQADKGLSKIQVWGMAKISSSTYGRMLRGCVVERNTIRYVAHVLGVKPEDLVADATLLPRTNI